MYRAASNSLTVLISAWLFLILLPETSQRFSMGFKSGLIGLAIHQRLWWEGPFLPPALILHRMMTGHTSSLSLSLSVCGR
ncbi:hypothetical protein BX666DRAFT_2006532 [Dichotomocladium elegans]|nr:hypothetical protein BX666DRAFT_2006532 [Dichotomocladium elegans]